MVISEFLYKPLDPTPAEIVAGFTDGKVFEYVELRNVGTVNADLSGCYFDKGITFTFPAGTILAPGASTLVVPNPAAFAFRYGSGRPTAGTNTGSLANEGERVLLLTPSGTPLVDFTYKLSGGTWPVEADTNGVSLVLINPASRPDPKLAINWRASRRAGGAPGFDDDATFATWAAAHNLTGDPSGDDDSDGISNSLEYALHTDPHTANPQPSGQLQALPSGADTATYLTTSFLRLVDASDIVYHVMYSENLVSWSETAVRVSVTDHYDGTTTETWRAPAALGDKGFLRVKITPP